MIRATVNQKGNPEKDRSELPEWMQQRYVDNARYSEQLQANASIRQFDTGATRDTDAGKIDFDGFLSPYALKAFGEYMDRHRHHADGKVRDSDNWQRGIPLDAYMKSMWRHFFDVWSEHRGVSTLAGLKENLCALKFNVDGMLHELVKAEHDHTPSAGYAMPLADRED
jgi:hypothetical protein